MPNLRGKIPPYKVDLMALHITAVCDHKCPFCYMSGIKTSKRKHPPLEKLFRVVEMFMSIIDGKSFVGIFLIILLLSKAYVSYGAASSKTSVGPFYLGMTEVEFKKITKKSPENCATCDDEQEETYIGLYKEELASNILPIDYEGIGFYFNKNRLKKIGISIKELPIADIRKVYKSVFENKCSSNKYSDGVVELTCSDKYTDYKFLYYDKDELVYVIKFINKVKKLR